MLACTSLSTLGRGTGYTEVSSKRSHLPSGCSMHSACQLGKRGKVDRQAGMQHQQAAKTQYGVHQGVVKAQPPPVWLQHRQGWSACFSTHRKEGDAEPGTRHELLVKTKHADVAHRSPAKSS